MSIDPLAYATFGDYLKAKDFDGARVTLVLDDGTVTATATSWSSVFKDKDDLSLAGGVWQDNVATFNGADGKTYQAIVPIIVNARTIEDTEIVLEGFEVVSETRRFSEMVKRYVGDGQIIEISYSLDSHMPTSVAIYNPFAFVDNDPFTKDGEQGKVDIKITFAEGGEREYPFTLKTVAEDGTVYIKAPTDTSKSEDAQVINYTIGYSEGESTAFNGSVEVSFRALRLNANNISSDIAVNDLDGKKVDFAPYSGMTTPDGKTTLVALYETTNADGKGKSLSELVELVGDGVTGSVTFYLEGRFIAEGEAVPEGYTKLENDGYKLVNGSYVPATVTVTPGEGGEDGITTSDATHVYVYLASYTLKASELTWDHSGISYNYNGGVKRTSVTIAHGAMKGTIQMPVNIVDGKIAELDFKNAAAEGAPADYSKYFKYGENDGKENVTGSAYFAEHWNDKHLVFDPFEGIEIDKQVTHKGEDDKTDIFDCYTYFPTKVGFKTADGYIVDEVSVTWSNLAGIRDTYRGGDYNVRLTVAAQGHRATPRTASSV